MFKNREIKVQVVKKTPKNENTQARRQPRRMTPMEINDLVEENARKLAAIGVVLYVTKKVVDTSCEIAVILANSSTK